MGKYDNLLKEDVFKVFGKKTIEKVLELRTDGEEQRKEFVDKLKRHDRRTTAILVLTLIKSNIVKDKELKDYYRNDLGEELRTGRIMPCQ